MILLLMLPVVLTFGATFASMREVPFKGVAVFLGHPYTALTITALVAIYFFGIRRGLTREKALPKWRPIRWRPMGTLLVHHGRRRRAKQVIVDSGVGRYAGKLLVHPADFAAVRGLADRRRDAHRAGLGHGGHHHRGGHRRAAGERHPRLLARTE